MLAQPTSSDKYPRIKTFSGICWYQVSLEPLRYASAMSMADMMRSFGLLALVAVDRAPDMWSVWISTGQKAGRN